jgi:hypothetical protein
MTFFSLDMETSSALDGLTVLCPRNARFGVAFEGNLDGAVLAYLQKEHI